MTDIVRSTIKALLASIIAAAVLIFLFGAIAAKNADPAGLTPIFGMAALIISALVGGISAGRSHRGIIAPIVFAAVYLLLVFGLSIPFGQSRNATATLLCYLGSLVSGILGGMLAKSKGAKKTKNFKKYKKMKKAPH